MLSEDMLTIRQVSRSCQHILVSSVNRKRELVVQTELPNSRHCKGNETTHLEHVSSDGWTYAGPAAVLSALWRPQTAGSQGLDAAATAQTLPPGAASATKETGQIPKYRRHCATSRFGHNTMDQIRGKSSRPACQITGVGPNTNETISFGT